MSLREALLRCFRDEPSTVFGIRDLCHKVQRYYRFSEFQRDLDPKHPQPRYEHEIRSNINRLKKGRVIVRLGFNRYRLS